MRIKKFLRRLISGVLILATLVLSLAAVGCAPRHKSRIAYGYFGGTYFTLHDYSGMSDGALDTLFEKLRGRLEYLGKLFDIYYEYSGMNNLRTVNLARGEAVEVAPEIIELLELSILMHERTGGEVNVAFGAVLSLWHAAREAGNYIPTEAELSLAAEHCNINNIRIDKSKSTVTLTDPEASLDVGAVAKGFAVEKLAEYAEELGASSLVIDVGGNLRTVGRHPTDGGWQVFVNNPVSGAEPRKIELSSVLGAAVTSGDYQRYFVYGGKKYHHIIDKDTLMPAEYFSSVTVVCETSSVADALSTALFSMSYEDGVELLSRCPEVSRAVFITRQGEVLEYSTAE